MVGLVPEHEDIFPVDRAVCEKEVGVHLSREASEPSIRQTGGSTIENTARKRAAARCSRIYRKPTTARGEPAILEVCRGRKPEVEQNLVISTVVRVGKGH